MRKKSNLTLWSSRKKKARTAARTVEGESRAAAEADICSTDKGEKNGMSAAAVADDEAATGAPVKICSPDRSSPSSGQRCKERILVADVSPRPLQSKHQRQRRPRQPQQAGEEEEEGEVEEDEEEQETQRKRRRQKRGEQEDHEEEGVDDAVAEGRTAGRRAKNSASSSRVNGGQHSRRLLMRASAFPLSTSRWPAGKSGVYADAEEGAEEEEEEEGQQHRQQRWRNRRKKKENKVAVAESDECEKEVSLSDGEDAGTSDGDEGGTEEQHATSFCRSGRARLSTRGKVSNRSRRLEDAVGEERRSSNRRRNALAEKERGRTRTAAVAAGGSRKRRMVNLGVRTSALSSSDEEEEYEAEDASDAVATAVCPIRRCKGRSVAEAGVRLPSRRGDKARGGSKLDRGRSVRQPSRRAKQERGSGVGGDSGEVSSGSTSRSGGEAEIKKTATRQRRTRGQGKRRKEEEETVETEDGEENRQTDIWYDDYFSFNECNVQDELLLDVLVATIKKSRAQHYYGSATVTEGQHSPEHPQLQDAKSRGRQEEEGAAHSTREDRPQREKALSFLASLRKNGVASRKSVGGTISRASSGGREMRRDRKRIHTQEELAQAAATAAEFEQAEATLRTMTSDALLIKKAWAYVAEEAFEARLAATAASPRVSTATSTDGAHGVPTSSGAGIPKPGRRQEEATALKAEQRQQQRQGRKGTDVTKDGGADSAGAAGTAAFAAAEEASSCGASPSAGKLPQDNCETGGSSASGFAEVSTQIEGESQNGKQEGENDNKGVKLGIFPADMAGKELIQLSTASFFMPIISSPTSSDDVLVLATAAAQAAAQVADEEAAEGAEPHETGLRARWQKYVLLRRQRLAMELRIQELIRLQEQQKGHAPLGGQKRQQPQRGDEEKFLVDASGRAAASEEIDELASRAAGLSFFATGPSTASGGVSSVAAAFMAARGILAAKDELTGRQKLELAPTGAHKRRASADKHEKEEEFEVKLIKTERTVEVERQVSLRTTAAVDASDTAKTTADASPAGIGNHSAPTTVTPGCLSPSQAARTSSPTARTPGTSLGAIACAARSAVDAGADVAKLSRDALESFSRQELKRGPVAAEEQEGDSRIVGEAKYRGIDEGEEEGGRADGARRGGAARAAGDRRAAAVDTEGVASGGKDVCRTLRSGESAKEHEQRRREGKSSGAREGKKRREGSRNVRSSRRRSRSRTPCGEGGNSRSLSLRGGQEEEDGDEDGGTRENEEEEKAEKLLRKLTQADADESLTSSSSSSPSSENGSSDEEDSLYEEDTALGEPPSSPDEEEGTKEGGSHHKEVAGKVDEIHSGAVLSVVAEEEKGNRVSGDLAGAQRATARDCGRGETTGPVASGGDGEEDEEDTEQEVYDSLQRNAADTGPKGEQAKERESGRRKEKRERTFSTGSLSDEGADAVAAATAAAKKKKLSTAAKLRLRWEREKQKKRLKAGETIMEDVFARCSAAPLSVDQATKMKNLSVPSTLLLRPQCLYTVEDDWEKMYCRKYPNGLLRRGTLAAHSFRIEETLEFFLFCRFLNLFASTIDIQWTFDCLVAGFACVSPLPPFAAADAATNVAGVGATATKTQEKPPDSRAPADLQHLRSQRPGNCASLLPEETACSSHTGSDESTGGGAKQSTLNNSDARSASSTSETGGVNGNTEDTSKRTGCNNYGNSGNTELFRLLLQKIFSFVGRRFSPGMSLVRMCGRYVEEKRKEGVLPVGMLWPFDYSFKFCAMKRASRDKDNGVKDSSSREASNRVSTAKEINDSASEKRDSILNRKDEGTSGAEMNSTRGEKSEDSTSYSKEAVDVEERISGCSSISKKGTPASSSSRNSVKGSREDDEAGGGEPVLMESVYNPFKLCDEWNQLKSIHKLRVVRLLIDQVLSESSQIQKARKKLSDADLESGYKGTDALGKLYWLVAQCGDETVFKLYREDPKTQRVEILCEDIAGLESVAEALGVSCEEDRHLLDCLADGKLQDEETADMKDVLLRCHEDLLIQEKQKSRELRRDKARRRQLEISAWGLPSSARRERKPVDYTYAAYDGALENRTPASAAATSAAEGQRLDRGERLRARLAKKEERMTTDVIDATESSGDAAVGDESSTTGPVRQSVSFSKDLADTRKPARKKQPKGAAVVLRSQADVLRQHQAYLMQHRHHSHFALQQSQALLLSQQLQRLQDDTDTAARQCASGPPPRVQQQQQQQPLLGVAGNYAGPTCSVPAAIAQLPPAALAVLQQRLQQVHHHLLQQEGLSSQQRQAALQHACARLQTELLARYGIVSAERHAASPQLQQQLLEQHFLRQQQQQQQARQQIQQQHAMHQHLQHLQEQAQRQHFLQTSQQQQHHRHQLLQQNVQDNELLGRRAALLQQSYQAQQLGVARTGGGQLPQQHGQPSDYAMAAQFNAVVHSANGGPINAVPVLASAGPEAYTGLIRQPTGGIEPSACHIAPVDTARHATVMYGGGEPRISHSGSCDKEDVTHRRGNSAGCVPERRIPHVDAGNCPATAHRPGTRTGYTQGSSSAIVVAGGTAQSGAGPPPGNPQYAMWPCAVGSSSTASSTAAILSRSVDDPPSSHTSAPGRAPGAGPVPSFYSSLFSHASLPGAGPSPDTGLATKVSTSHVTAHLTQSRLGGSYVPSPASQPPETSQSSSPVPTHVDGIRPGSPTFPFPVTGCYADGGKYSAHS